MWLSKEISIFISFIKYAKKIVPSPWVRKFTGIKMPLLVQHINMCHPDYPNICLMTECELGDTSLKKIAIRVVDELTIQDFQFPLK